MADIIRLATKSDPHVAGPARCQACKHEWIAVAPVGTYKLDCPDCRSEKGYFMVEVDDAEAERSKCKCGCDVFRVFREQFQCVNCGNGQRF